MSLTNLITRFAQRETPFYYYDTDLLKETLRTAKAAGEGFELHYAVKANANPAVLRTIAEAGLGADCVSGGEIKACLKAGFAANKLMYAGTGKKDWEIRLGIEQGIAAFNVESIPELEIINALAAELGQTARIAFRINPNIDAHTHEYITTGLEDNKFGISMDDMESSIRRAQELSNVEYVGLHFHIGSQILSFGCFEKLGARINELQDRLEAAGILTPNINVGGGLGIDYEHPDQNPVPAFADYFAALRRALNVREGQTLHCEPGRSLVAQCGSLITRVVLVKQTKTKQFAIVDGGFTDLIRPALYGAYHQIENLSSKEAAERYDVVGPICESSDVFQKDVLLPACRRGDFLALRSAGAYGEVMASAYNCRKVIEGYTGDEL